MLQISGVTLRPDPRSVYTVEITPAAWTQLAHLKVETYRRIREALDAVAATLSHGQASETPRAAGSEAPGRSPVRVEELLAHYDVDHAQQCVRLLQVEQRRSGEP